MGTDCRDVKRNYVVNCIIESIRNGEYAKGEALTERALAEKLNVSRTPIREAFRCLEEIGLVKSEPHKGVRIASYSHRKIADLYDVRENLEGLAARSAASKRRPEELAAMRAVLELADRYAEVNDIETLAQTNLDFHQQLAEMSHNDYLINLLSQVRENISLLFSESLRQKGRPKRTMDEHWLVYQAIDMGYEDLAESAARLHIRNAYNNVIVKLAKDMLTE